MSDRFNRAREALPLPRLMQGLGLTAHAAKSADCPFCQGKKKFGIKTGPNGYYFFHCFSDKCVANESGNEIRFLELWNKCGPDLAKEEFYRLASKYDPSLLDEKRYPPRSSTAPSPSKPVEPLNPWHDLWQRMPLITGHKEALQEKRGFTPANIRELGFRSSIPSNALFAAPLIEKWGESELFSLGIVDGDGALNPQLRGFGMTGRKDADGENEMAMGANPIIIPYLDDEGIPYYLRPHKGGLKRVQNDPWFKEAAGGYVYCPWLLRGERDNFDALCIITEGEFKAGALNQAGVPALAVPGIQFPRARAGDISRPDFLFREELVSILKRAHITNIVVAFDNEVKDDPSLPSYKADPWNRHDTNVWADYLCYDLQKDFPDTTIRIGHLPDEWRINGKADFDSALATFVKANGETDGTRLARQAFLGIIRDARERNDYLKRFPAATQNIIRNKRERLFYVPNIKSGGPTEEKLARRFAEPDPFRSTPGKPVAIDEELALAFKATKGCYFERESVDAKTHGFLNKKLEDIDEAIAKEEALSHPAPAPTNITVFNPGDQLTIKKEKPPMLNHAKIQALRSAKAAIWERKKGMPVLLSDFTIDCEYMLHTSDGDAVRLIKIINKSGRANGELIRLTGTHMRGCRDFREFIYRTGFGVPMFGEKALQQFVADMDHHAAYRDIYEVNTYGWHPQSKLWFYGDCAVAPDGAILKTDDQGIIWYEGIGYQVEAPIGEDDISTGFEQGAPKILSMNGDAGKLEISDRELLEHMADDLLEAMGGYDSWASIGLFFAAACAPEMLDKYHGQPGVFFYGNLSEGKTTTMQLLMRIQGFKHLDGLSIEPTTEVAMARALSHYGCLFLWFDEFRAANLRDRPGKLTILRDSFNRGAAAKGYASDPRKTRMVRPNTTAVVTGESSTGDGATRSRFCLVNISKSRRRPRSEECWVRANAEAPHWYRLWKYIMVNRTKFAALTMSILAEQMVKQQKNVPNERIRHVYFSGYAAFAALNRMLETSVADPSSETDRLAVFEEELVKHAVLALRDVTEETFLQAFWRDVISGLQNSDIKHRFLKTRVVIMEEGVYRNCSDEELKNGAIKKSTLCFVNFPPLYDSCAAYVRTAGRVLSQSLGDIRKSMSTEKWCVKAKNTERFQDGPKHPLVISLEPEDGFPFIDDLTSILSTLKPEA